MANRNQSASESFLAKSQPVILGKVSEFAQNAEFQRIVEKAVQNALAKLRGGSSTPGATEHNLAIGANTITLADAVTPLPYYTPRGSDAPRLITQNRNAYAKASHVTRGLRGAHERWHLAKNNRVATCQLCQAETMAKVDNQARHLQQGQE
jgi:hypothetical protein